MGCSHNKVTGIREGNSEKLGGVEIRTLRGDATLRKRGGQWCQKLQWSRKQRAEAGLMEVGEGGVSVNFWGTEAAKPVHGLAGRTFQNWP